MGRKVLVVDDEVSIVEFLRDLLTTEGYEVHAAYDAEQALDRIREDIYDLAIVDFSLPDMDGVMLHRRIRQMDFELASRTLFTSGLVQSETNLGYYAAQAAGFLAKPFDLPRVLGAVREILGEPVEDDG